MVDPPLECDPETGLPVTRVFHPIAVHFKGKGFYNTDYGTKKRAREKDAHDSSKKKAEKSDAKGESKSDSGAKTETTSSRPRRRRTRPSARRARRARRAARRPPSPPPTEPAAHPARKRRTFACLTVSGTCARDRAEQSVCGEPADRQRAEEPEQRRPAHVRAQRLGHVPGDERQPQERHGDSSRLFIAATIFCWRRARVRSFSLRAVVVARAGERQRLLAVDVGLAGLQAQRVAAAARSRR